LILVKAFYYVAFGIFLYQLTIGLGDMEFSAFAIKEIVFDMTWWLGGIILISGLGSVVVESGLFNMYKLSLVQEPIDSNVFFAGVRKYFIRMLLANLLLFAFWLLILIPYVIVGVLTLLAGFVIVPLIISVFTTMWKVSIVVDELSVIEGLKSGIRFAKKNFIPLSVLVIVKQAFLMAQTGSGGSGGGNSNNFNSTGDFSQFTEHTGSYGNIPDISFQEGFAKALPYIKTGFYVLIPVVGIAIVIGSLVKMVFEIFFGLSIFVMYLKNSEEMVKDELTMEVE